MPYFVQLYKSTDTNAPVLLGAAGSLVGLLDTVLVNGYTTATVGNITRALTVATVVLAVPNSTLVTGNYVTIAGCNQVDYNGTFQITVVNATTFTYIVANSPATPATTSSTITYRKASLQWEKPYSGTNKAAYRSADVSSNRFYLQVIDNASTAGGVMEASVRGFESMTDVDTGIQPFPTLTQLSTGLSWKKSTGIFNASPRPWTIIGDSKTFYLLMNCSDTVESTLITAFGHFPSQKPGDNFNTFITGNTGFNQPVDHASMNWGFSTLGTFFGTISNSGLYFARNWTQLGSAVQGGYCNWNQTHFGFTATLPYPHQPDGGAYMVQPVFHEIVNGNNALRGKIPGIYQIFHAYAFNHYDTLTGVTNLPGKVLTILSFKIGNLSAGQAAFDTFGPWD